MAVGYQEVTFRSRSGRALTLVALAIGGLAIVGFFTNQGVLAGAITAVVVAVVISLLYLTLWRPRLEVHDSGIVIVNPFTTHRLDWNSIRSVEMSWALVIKTATRRITVFSVPRASRGFDAMGMRLDPFKLPDYQAQKQHEEQDFGSRAENAALLVIQSRLNSGSR